MADLTVEEALRLGISAHKSGRYEEAERYYKAILRSSSMHADANHNMGVLCVTFGKYEEAIKFFRKALKANPSVPQFWLSIVNALVKTDRLIEAKNSLVEAAGSGISGSAFDKLNDMVETRIKGRTGFDTLPKNDLKNLMLLLQAREFESVIQQTSSLLEKFPESTSLIAVRGAAYIALRDYEKAISLYKKSICLQPENPESYFNLGNAFKEKGDLNAAILNYKRAIEIRPSFAEAHNNLGNIFKDQGDINAAISSYEDAIKIKPEYSDALNNIANLYMEKGDLETSISTFKKSLKISPNNSLTLFNLANALTKKGETLKAIQLYEKAVSISPGYAEAFNNLGNAQMREEDLSGAEESYKKALELKPDYAEAEYNLIELLRIHCPSDVRSVNLFKIDAEVRKKSKFLKDCHSEEDVAIKLIEIFDFIDNEGLNYNTPLTQIYRRNTIDLNCDRHLKLFHEHDIIPNFCFDCYKVQFDVTSVLSLVYLVALFYDLKIEKNLSRKCFIEVRPNISGFYKGLIYCRGVEEAERTSEAAQALMKNTFLKGAPILIKRGCSEYPVKYPDYSYNGPSKQDQMLQYPKKWQIVEDKFDSGYYRDGGSAIASISEFCLSDFYIIQKWIDYAKGLGDPTAQLFNSRIIHNKNVYGLAAARKTKFDYSLTI